MEEACDSRLLSEACFWSTAAMEGLLRSPNRVSRPCRKALTTLICNWERKDRGLWLDRRPATLSRADQDTTELIYLGRLSLLSRFPNQLPNPCSLPIPKITFARSTQERTHVHWKYGQVYKYTKKREWKHLREFGMAQKITLSHSVSQACRL